MATTDLQRALSDLESRKKERLAAAEREAKQFDEAIAQLKNLILVVEPSEVGPLSREFEGLSIGDATRRWLTEVGEGKTTREIAETLLSRGMTTRSDNYVATVYSILVKDPQLVRKNGLWDLRERHRGK